MVAPGEDVTIDQFNTEVRRLFLLADVDKSGDLNWGFVVASLRSPGTINALRAADHRFVVERGPGGILLALHPVHGGGACRRGA